MVSAQSVNSQLKRLGFNTKGWRNQAEVRELPHILLDDEEIYECVNGHYEGGFALLVATNVRVLLVDKKPLNFLTVEDCRFDMINEIDYNHRLFGAQISISTGSKILRFASSNQPRLRKLIGHVQHCMAELKKQQTSQQAEQKQHLEQINQQLILAQQLQTVQADRAAAPQIAAVQINPLVAAQSPSQTQDYAASPLPAELYAEGVREVFGRQLLSAADTATVGHSRQAPHPAQVPAASHGGIADPLRIACAKLPIALRNRKFGPPSSFRTIDQPLPVTPTT